MTSRRNFAILAVALVLFAMATRVLFNALHVFNFNAIMAAGLFAGAYASNRRTSFLVPMIAMLATDVVLGFYDWKLMAVVYGAVAFAVVLGQWYRTAPSVSRLTLSTVTGSLAFFLATNAAVWLFGDGTFYPHTFEGLIQSYVMGLPFYKMSFVGDLVWTGALFGSFEMVRAMTNRKSVALAA
jgi:hypothetical protein